MNIEKQGKRNVVSRYLHARNDKEKIVAWRLDLNRILHVFNVRPTVSLRLLLTLLVDRTCDKYTCNRFRA